MTEAFITEILTWSSVIEILRSRFLHIRETRAEIILRVGGKAPDVIEPGHFHVSLKGGKWEGYVNEGRSSGVTNGTPYAVDSRATISRGWCIREVVVNGKTTSANRFRLGRDRWVPPFSCIELLKYVERTGPLFAGTAQIGLCRKDLFFVGVVEDMDAMPWAPEQFFRTYTVRYFDSDDGFMLLEQEFDKNGDFIGETEYRRLE